MSVFIQKLIVGPMPIHITNGSMQLRWFAASM